MKKRANAIDPGLFGALLRHERQEQGYSTAEEFAAAITEMTGYGVSKETIYKIESGKQEPKLSLFMAIKFLLFPNEKPSLGDPFDVSLPSYWRHPIEDDYHECAEYDSDGSVFIDIPGIAQKEARKALEAKKGSAGKGDVLSAANSLGAQVASLSSAAQSLESAMSPQVAATVRKLGGISQPIVANTSGLRGIGQAVTNALDAVGSSDEE